MDRVPSRRTGRRAALALALGLALGVAMGPVGSAVASPETLKRSVSNILFGPFDIILAPVVGSRTVYRNLQDIEDSMWVRVAYAVPGVAWNTTLEAGAGILRCMTGLIELVPGIGLLPFEADLNPLFAPAEKADALVDKDTPLLFVKFGVDYVD